MGGRAVEPHEAERWVAAYVAGESFLTIAARENRAPVTVWKYVKLQGVKIRCEGGSAGSVRTPEGQRPVRPEEIQMWVSEYEVGKSVGAIAQVHGVSDNAVRRALKKAGVRLVAGPRNPALIGLTPEQRQRRTTVQKYGLSHTDYEAMLQAQDGRCAICMRLPPGRCHGDSVLAVDHDHVTGQVRRLLCRDCNRGLGCFRDDPEAMRRSAMYVETAGQLTFEPGIGAGLLF